MKLTDQDYAEIAKQEGINVAALKAIKAVESNGSGFLADGRPVILFEGHKFYAHLKSKPDILAKAYCERPDLCFPKWTKAHYKGGAAEWNRLDAAIKYDREAALKAASYGAFQILGENHKQAGFDTVQGFVNAMFKSEREQLIAVCKFIKNSKILSNALRNLNWAAFAKAYNGPAYAQNAYDKKLATAYNKYA